MMRTLKAQLPCAWRTRRVIVPKFLRVALHESIAAPNGMKIVPSHLLRGGICADAPAIGCSIGAVNLADRGSRQLSASERLVISHALHPIPGGTMRGFAVRQSRQSLPRESAHHAHPKHGHAHEN